jgi:DNA-binding transcriptional MerR regulator
MNRAQRRPKSRRRKPAAPAIPAAAAERTYRIGDAARMVDVEAYVLRFWETQFPILRPAHATSKHRIYLPKDIETLKFIKRLLHEERFTIEGARKYIKEHGLERAMKGITTKSRAGAEPAAPSSAGKVRTALSEIQRDLRSIHKLLTD